MATIRRKFEVLRPFLDERRRRLWAATEALALGRGGVPAVATATGLRRHTIHAGIGDRRAGGPAAAVPERRVRAAGGGRKALTARDPTVLGALGKAIPYGVYAVAANPGGVSVGTAHDTPAFAVQSVRRWWEEIGRPIYPQATEGLITAAGGGSNGSRARRWKTELQRLADETGLRITVCHFPPGTSKWNTIEHRMVCHITPNWRGRPLVSHAVVVQLIGSTTTRAGLTIRADRDPGTYPTGIKVTDAELATVRLEPADFHGDWNYTIAPRTPSIAQVLP